MIFYFDAAQSDAEFNRVLKIFAERGRRVILQFPAVGLVVAFADLRAAADKRIRNVDRWNRIVADLFAPGKIILKSGFVDRFRI
jgi:hypothetical protein